MKNNKNIVQKLLQEASFFEDRGKTADAAKKYAEILEHSPNNINALYGLGMCLINQKEFADGEKLLQKGMTLYPHTDWFYDALYVHENVFNNHKEVSNIIKLWLKNIPNSGLAHARNADFLMKNKSGNYTEILREAKEGIRLNPVNSTCIETMAFALWKAKGEINEAKEYFIHALKLDPHDAILHNNFGHFLLMTGDPRRALDEFRMALRLNPTLKVSVNNLGKALYATNRFLGWRYNISVFMTRHPVFNRLNGVIAFFVIRGLIELEQKGIISSFVLLSILIPYLIYLLFSYFGYSTFMYLFKKGWIV